MAEKPVGVTLPPRSFQMTQDESEFMTEQARFDRDMTAINEMKRSQRDQIGELIGGTYYYQNKPFASVLYRGVVVTVSRWYPQRQVAIDIFKDIGETERHEIAFKRQAFHDLGVRYGVLSYSSDLAALLPQIGVY